MRKKFKKINLKSNSGFTMVDLVIALAIFALFATVIGNMMFSAYKTNLQVEMSGASIYYAMQILEDIDKIPYEDVKNGMESSYISKFSIPSAFTVNVNVSNHNEGTNKEDLIKKVKITITYEFSGNSESIVINKLKVKEV